MDKYELIGKIKLCAEKRIHEENVYENCQIIIDMNYQMQKTALKNRSELDDELDELLTELAKV